jgi:hypothetical protein
MEVSATEQAIEVTQQIGRGEVGRLAIGFVDSAMYTLLPEILRVFRVTVSGCRTAIA